MDINPFGGNFNLTTGLTFCESTMRYRAHYTRVLDEISIGYTCTILNDHPLYYSIDLGINYMGSGTFRSSNKIPPCTP